MTSLHRPLTCPLIELIALPPQVLVKPFRCNEIQVLQNLNAAAQSPPKRQFRFNLGNLDSRRLVVVLVRTGSLWVLHNSSTLSSNKKRGDLQTTSKLYRRTASAQIFTPYSLHCNLQLKGRMAWHSFIQAHIFTLLGMSLLILKLFTTVSLVPWIDASRGWTPETALSTIQIRCTEPIPTPAERQGWCLWSPFGLIRASLVNLCLEIHMVLWITALFGSILCPWMLQKETTSVSPTNVYLTSAHLDMIVYQASADLDIRSIALSLQEKSYLTSFNDWNFQRPRSQPVKNIWYTIW